MSGYASVHENMCRPAEHNGECGCECVRCWAGAYPGTPQCLCMDCTDVHHEHGVRDERAAARAAGDTL